MKEIHTRTRHRLIYAACIAQWPLIIGLTFAGVFQDASLLVVCAYAVVVSIIGIGHVQAARVEALVGRRRRSVIAGTVLS